MFVGADTLYAWVRLCDMNLDPYYGARVTIQEYACNRVSKEEQTVSLLIYPNPCNEKITIKLPNTINEGVLCLIDLQGRVLLQKQINSMETETNISWLPPGIYLCKFFNNDAVLYGKLLKE